VELFYVIADADSATARREVQAGPHAGKIRFRNLFYPEVEADFRARGGDKPPALWDGERLHAGLDAIRARLSAGPGGAGAPPRDAG
jgi:hypothetical protein